MWQDQFFVPTQYGFCSRRHTFPVHGLQTGQVACTCAHGDTKAECYQAAGKTITDEAYINLFTCKVGDTRSNNKEL